MLNFFIFNVVFHTNSSNNLSFEATFTFGNDTENVQYILRKHFKAFSKLSVAFYSTSMNNMLCLKKKNNLRFLVPDVISHNI